MFWTYHILFVFAKIEIRIKAFGGKFADIGFATGV